MGLLVSTSSFLTGFVVILILCLIQENGYSIAINKEALKARVKEMFLHGYYSYKNHAFPADELLPLSCKGRYRDIHNSRGDIDDALGNFSLTMLDTLDSLFLFGEFDEFEKAVRSVVQLVKFDTDVDVSVFETNIRVLGGLLGAHVAALSLKHTDHSRMQWYQDELLHMATDIGNRLLPAFNTSTGIPYPRVNLRHGCVGLKRQEEHTCTACAGTMILEFAALSRLTGNPIFEQKAKKSLAYLWKQRNRFSDLVGRVINVHSGDWVRQESGVGAGIDSYYEYLIKAYMMLGESVYLHRFQIHYDAINRYVGGPQSAEFPFLFLDVHMHKPNQRARPYMDALLAFWPGIQVLTGDVKQAIALHELLYLIHKRNRLLPEAFTSDMNIHWGQHLLRPELIESTYMLYHATKDPYYLNVGIQLLNDLQNYTRVPCGFAAIKDVRTMEHTDQFDSFVLAETFKYLYLLFTDPKDLPINLDNYVFTTEAHLLPINLSQLRFDVNRTEKLLNTSQNTHNSSLLSSSSSSPEESSSNLLIQHSNNDFDERDYLMEKLIHNKAQCIALNLPDLFTSKTNQFKQCKQPNSGSSSYVYNPYSEKCKSNLKYHQFLCDSLSSYSSASSYSSVTATIGNNLFKQIDRIREPLRKFESSLHDSNLNYDFNESKNIVLNKYLKATEFQIDNLEHIKLLKRMGISLIFDKDGKLTLTHQHDLAESSDMSMAGIIFIQELIALTKFKQELVEVTIQNRHVVLLDPPSLGFEKFVACPAHFGHFPGELSEIETNKSNPVSSSISDQNKSSSNEQINKSQTDKDLNNTWQPLVGTVRIVQPFDACNPISPNGYAYPSYIIKSHLKVDKNDDNNVNNNDHDHIIVNQSVGPINGSIGIVQRGGCFFLDKAQNLFRAGAIGVIVVDNHPNTSSKLNPLFTMSGDENQDKNDIPIPVVLLFGIESAQLFEVMQSYWNETYKPTTVMITKQYDATVSFNMAIWNLIDKQKNTEKVSLTQSPEFEFPNYDLENSFHVNYDLLLTEPIRNPYRINSLNSISFGLLRLPGPEVLSSPFMNIDHNNHSVVTDSNSNFTEFKNQEEHHFSQSQLVTPIWLFTLFMHEDEREHYFIYKETTSSYGYANNLTLWSNILRLLVNNLKISQECKHLIQSFIHVGLYKTSMPNSSYHTKTNITISVQSFRIINQCFNDLLTIFTKEYNTEQSTSNNFNGISLRLEFQFIPPHLFSTADTEIYSSVNQDSTKMDKYNKDEL